MAGSCVKVLAGLFQSLFMSIQWSCSLEDNLLHHQEDIEFTAAIKNLENAYLTNIIETDIKGMIMIRVC